MTTTIFIPLNERREHFPLLTEIAEACFGDNDKVNFSEEFVPPRGKVPAPKADNFVRFLVSDPKLLWAIQYNGKTVGFILISDIPHNNSIGFGIDVNYAGKGIVPEAFNQIKCNEKIQYPLEGYTSQENTRANKLMIKLGFKLLGQVNFMGEKSNHYIKEKMLCKKDLQSCAYYAGAGIDIQPILKFGDYISDFIYVSVGITKIQLIEGIEHCIKLANQNLINSSIKILNISDFKITDIEHKPENRLVSSLPDYFDEDQHRNYFENFSQFYNKRDDYNLKFDIELNIGGIIRQIRLIHLTGEALATYDVIFRKQQIAPKMFISIQTGRIEIPNNFSNRMFELSATRPKIWLRGKWNYRLFDETMHNQVFSTEGIYNRRIGEYDYWDANFNYQIDGVTNPENDYRTVKAFGEDSVWKYPNGYQVILKNEGIIINKNLGLYFERKDYYHSVKRHFELTRMDEIYQEFLNSDEQTYRVVITPGGYEMYELYLHEFVKNFKPIKDRLLHIDIFYEHISDLIRN